jgi:hypothetical protein
VANESIRGSLLLLAALALVAAGMLAATTPRAGMDQRPYKSLIDNSVDQEIRNGWLDGALSVYEMHFAARPLPA